MLQQPESVVQSHVHTMTYVLTFDLPQKVESFQRVGLKTIPVDNPFFNETRNEIVNFIQFCYPGHKIHLIFMQNLIEQIKTATIYLNDCFNFGTFYISTLKDLRLSFPGTTLSINRLVNTDGKRIGIGPRPGAKFLKQQIDHIIQNSDSKPIIIVEDGSFSGDTVKWIIDLFRQNKLEIAGVVMGIGREQALTEIREVFSGEIIITEEINEDIIDWMPDYDFFPTIPNCGKIVGHIIKEQPCPIYTHNGFSFSIPYIFPFAPIGNWASIKNHDLAIEMSLYCIQRTIELYEIIESLNGRKISTSDFEENQLISIPFSCGQTYIPKHDNVRILDYLTEAKHKIN